MGFVDVVFDGWGLGVNRGISCSCICCGCVSEIVWGHSSWELFLPTPSVVQRPPLQWKIRGRQITTILHTILPLHCPTNLDASDFELCVFVFDVRFQGLTSIKLQLSPDWPVRGQFNLMI